MKRLILNSAAVASFCFVAFLSSPVFAKEDKGGFSLGSTRVVYTEEHKEATFTVINSAKNAPFLAQSWLTALNTESDKSKPPFVITPPLYRQDEGKNTLRIIRTGGNLPSDRESAFWLNVKAIPAQAKDNKSNNVLSFAFVLKVKMFYRPTGLPSSSDQAYKKLTFNRNGNELIVHNSTPYYITFNNLSVGKSEVKDLSAMVPPMGKQYFKLPQSTFDNQVTYKVINDMGGITPEEKKEIAR